MSIEVINQSNNVMSGTANFTAYQEVFHHLTKKIDTLHSSSDKNLIIDFLAIESLHNRIIQVCQTYNVSASNLNISIYHNDKYTEELTDFVKFSTYNQHQTKHVIRITLNYSFLLVSPDGKSYPYKLELQFVSRIAAKEELSRNNKFFTNTNLISLLVSDVAEVKVEYVDYIKGRMFINVFDEWIENLPVSKENKIIKFIEVNSSVLQFIIKNVFFLVFTYSLYRYLTITSISNNNELSSLLFASIVGSGFFVIGTTFCIKNVFNSISHYDEMSYIKINKADELLIAKIKRRQNRIIWKSIAKTIVAVICGVIVTNLDNVLLQIFK